MSSNLKVAKENFLEFYCHTIYKFFGRIMFANKKFKFFFFKHFYNKRYEGILKKANLRIIPDEYFLAIFMSLIFVLILIFVSSVTFLFINPLFTLLIFYGGIFILATIGILMYNYPIVLSRTRGQEIDASIPYVLPYMKLLSKELSIAKIIDLVDDFLIYKEVKIEFERIKYYSSVLGYDIHSSIREAMASCPSKQLSDMMNDMVTISNSGGDVYAYLERKLDNLNQEIDAIEKKNIETLLIYSQIYVIILLIAPLFYAIMSSVLTMVDFTGGGTGQGTISSILLLLISLPVAYVGFMMLIYYSKPLYSRIKPMKDEN